MPLSVSVHAFRGVGGGFGNSENLESGRFHRLRKCLDAFYNDSRGRKFNCQEVRGPG